MEDNSVRKKQNKKVTVHPQTRTIIPLMQNILIFIAMIIFIIIGPLQVSIWVNENVHLWYYYAVVVLLECLLLFLLIKMFQEFLLFQITNEKNQNNNVYGISREESVEKPLTHKDDLQEQDVRQTAVKLMRTLFTLLVFIFLLAVFSINVFIIADYSLANIILDGLYLVFALVLGSMMVPPSIHLYNFRKWFWQKRGEMVKIGVHKVRSLVNAKDFRLAIQALLTTLAIVLLLFGIGWGFTSHEVHYFQTIPKESPFTITVVTSHNNEEDIYLQPTKDQRIYYIIHAKDFTAPFTAQTFFKGHDILSMICKQDINDLFLVDVTLDNKDTLHGIGCTVVELRLQLSDPQKRMDFMTAEYATNHSDYYQNNWPLGAGVVGASVLFIVAVFLLPAFWRRKTNPQGV